MYLVGSVPRPPAPAPLLGVKSLDFDPILDTAGLTAAGTLPPCPLPPALLSVYFPPSWLLSGMEGTGPEDLAGGL